MPSDTLVPLMSWPQRRAVFDAPPNLWPTRRPDTNLPIETGCGSGSGSGGNTIDVPVSICLVQESEAGSGSGSTSTWQAAQISGLTLQTRYVPVTLSCDAIDWDGAYCVTDERDCCDSPYLVTIPCGDITYRIPTRLCVYLQEDGSGDPPGTTVECAALYAQPVPITYQGELVGRPGFPDQPGIYQWTGQIVGDRGCAVSIVFSVGTVNGQCEIGFGGTLVWANMVGFELIGPEMPDPIVTSTDPFEVQIGPGTNDSASQVSGYIIRACSGGATGGGGTGSGGFGGGGGGTTPTGDESSCEPTNPCASLYYPTTGSQSTVSYAMSGTCTGIQTPTISVDYIATTPNISAYVQIGFTHGTSDYSQYRIDLITLGSDTHYWRTYHGTLSNCVITDLGTYREFEFDFTPYEFPGCTFTVVVTQTGGTAC